MAEERTFTLGLDVHDANALCERARAHFIEAQGGADTEGVERMADSLFRPDGDVDVDACIVQLLDPGASLPGTVTIFSECRAGTEEATS